MPGIARVNTDIAGGVIVGPGSSTMLVDGKPVSFIGDVVATHGNSPHNSPTLVAGGASTIVVDGEIPAMQRSQAACGHTVSPGSSKMIVS